MRVRDEQNIEAGFRNDLSKRHFPVTIETVRFSGSQRGRPRAGLAVAPARPPSDLHLGQTAQAFGQVQGALSWFIDAYPTLADWSATVQRLAVFASEAAADQRPGQQAAAGTVQRVPGAGEAIEFSSLVVRTPDGRELVRLHDHRLEPGTHVLLSGPSGSGKTSLLRVIAGLWRHGEGTLRLPRGASLMMLPQHPYLPDGTLAAALAYPLPEERFDDDAVARSLLHRPDWVFLDEASSALDEPAEQALYECLRNRLPDTTIVSVGHRSTLRRLHDTEWKLQPQAATAATTPPRQPSLQARTKQPSHDPSGA